ncbi:MAG: hypothetical protein RR495_04110 [Anaerovoracaceae bacterium]
MIKKINPYYVGSGILFAISGLVSKHYLLIICGIALVSLGFAMGKTSNEKGSVSAIKKEKIK